MTDLTFKRLLLGTTLLVGLSAAPALAQQSSTNTGVPEADEQRADGVFESTITDDEREDFIDEQILGSDDEIVVTGSRLRRDTFSSITPLQVIDTDFAAEQGLFNPVEILQSSNAASGQQIDSTFGGFVLDNGPGSETVNLRGLGPGRTLIVMDGRRVSPAGVEGAPSQPSINLIPQTFVDRYDLLLDGASSVYGSDAVAGVVNAILKKDFDGLEVDVRTSLPEQGGGEAFVAGASYGINADRGYIGFQGEYRLQENFTIGDRDFFEGCETFRERDEQGNILTVNTTDNFFDSQLGLVNTPSSACRATRLTQRIFIPNNFGSIYYQPGIANTGIDSFSESTLFGVPLDFNDDQARDVNFFQFSPNGQQQDLQDFGNRQDQYSARVTGEYALEGAANVTPYFDVMYTRLETETRSAQGQLFPDVPANNPFNPCNIDAPNGQDCNAAYNAVLTDPRYTSLFQAALNNSLTNTFGGGPRGVDNCFGLGDTPACNPVNFGLLAPTGISFEVTPIVGVFGDRNFVETELDQTRILGGVRGDIPGLSFGGAGDFSWDVHALHTLSDGESRRPGIRDDRLALSLGINPINANGVNVGTNGAVLPGGPCSATFLPADITSGCVPVNLFAPSLYESAAGGDFATQAERDYLFDDRDFGTVYEQTLIDASIQGALFELPGGTARAILGGQFRWDDIDSQPDAVANDGLLFGFFVDGGASGDRLTKEAYAEVSLPLGTGTPGFREFNVDLAGRLTDDEFYGTNETYSIKAGWRPIDALLVRGTYGTSFRAPTVRELFLANQSGFGTVADPCSTPDAAFLGGDIGGGGGYDRGADPRTDITLDNCRLAGIDPTNFRVGNAGTGVEINRTSNLNLNPEESESFTVGASFDQPFTDLFDLELGATYYEYSIDDTFVELGTGLVLRNCYVEVANLAGEFCDNITRDAAGNLENFRLNFINRENDTVRGLDFNVDARVQDVSLFEQNVDFGFTGSVSHLLERSFTFDLDGETAVEEQKGDFNFADWEGFGTASVAFDKLRFSWTTNYIGSVEADQGLDQQGNPELGTPAFTNFVDARFDDTVVGGTVTSAGPEFGGVNTIPVSQADDYWEHSASLIYTFNEDLSILAGVSNIFEEEPPFVDPSEVFSVNNVALGGGYDYSGRTYFLRLNAAFR